MAALNLTDEALRNLVQGPGDVEWRQVRITFLPSYLNARLGRCHRSRWSRYEMRRECQEILPGLLLGPFQASKSLETLKSLGVTHM